MVDIHENFYARNGVEGRDHIPALPFWMAIVRIVQFVRYPQYLLSNAWLTASQVLTLLVMILSAFASSVFGAGYVSFPPSFWSRNKKTDSKFNSGPAMVRFKQRDLARISTDNVLGMSFFVFVWTLLFLAYVRDNLP